MKVKDLVRLLQQQDQEKEVIKYFRDSQGFTTVYGVRLVPVEKVHDSYYRYNFQTPVTQLVIE